MRKAHVIHELRLHGLARGNANKPIATLRQMLKLARSRTRNSAEEPSTTTTSSHANAGNEADNNANKLDATVAAPHAVGVFLLVGVYSPPSAAAGVEHMLDSVNV